MEVDPESSLGTWKIMCGNFNTDWHVEPDFCVYVLIHKANGRFLLSETHTNEDYRDSVAKQEIKRGKVRFYSILKNPQV